LLLLLLLLLLTLLASSLLTLLSLLTLWTLLLLQRLQALLHRLGSLNRVAELVQGLLLFLVLRIVCSGCSLADLFFDVFKTFLDGLLVLSGVTVVSVLRSAVIEHPFTLLDPVLQLLVLDRIVCGTCLVRGVPVLLIVTQGFQLVGHRLQ